MVNSKQKGMRTEREAAQLLSELGWPSRRTQQYQGVGSDGDIVIDTAPGLHIECKSRDRLALYKWLDQAVRDSMGKRLPVVMCKADRKPWLIMVEVQRLVEFLDTMVEARREVPQAQAGEHQDAADEA